jgi:hemoglobin
VSAAAGGPITYVGRDMKAAHHELGITADDWEIFRAILNETLESLRIAPGERRELVEYAEGLKADIVQA